MTSKLVIGGTRGGLLFGVSTIATAALSLPTQILLERSLGVQGFAQWAFLNSLCTILTTIACLGANSLILSEFFQGRLQTRQGLTQVLVYLNASSLLGALGFLGVYLWTMAGRTSLLPSMPLEIIVFLAQIPILLVYPVFQIKEQAREMALWPLFQNLSRFVVALMAAVMALSYTSTVALWTLFSLVLAAWAVKVCWSLIAKRLHGVRRDLRSFLRQEEFFAVTKSGLGFGANEALDSLDLKLVVPVAAILFGTQEISAAALAMLFLFAVHFFPWVLVSRMLLPAVHRSSETDPQPLYTMVSRLCLFSIAVLLPASIVFFYFGYSILMHFVSGDYSSQQGTFRALSVAFIPTCLSILGAAPFMSKRENLRLLRWRIEALVIFIATTLVLSHKYSVASLFWAVAISRTYMCVRSFLELRNLRKMTDSMLIQC